MPQTDSKNVLIVDDSVDMRELLTLLLESKGYSVDTRNNGEEALELLNSNQPLPSLILLDLRMPVMDGFDFLKQKKKSAKFQNIPVIMITAEDDLSAVENKLEVKQVLVKPLSMKSVLNAVDQTTWLH